MRLFACALALTIFGSPAEAVNIPSTQATALDGHTVTLPANLPAATIFILGFSRHSVDATTAWEKPVRAQFGKAGSVTFYDTAMIASVPKFARSFAVSRIRKAVPDVLKPNFLPLMDHEAEWKQAAAFDPKQGDAAYVVLVDSSGAVRWSTHEAFRPALFQQLADSARTLGKRP